MLRPPWHVVRLGAALVACAATTSGSSAAPTSPVRDSVLADRLTATTRQSVWTLVAAVPLRFRTFHPQGLVKIGAEFYLSSVEVRRRPTPAVDPRNGRGGDAGAGVGHLFRFAADGALRSDLHLGEGAAYHPGGIDFDGRRIWVPVSEYRPDSRAIIYTVDPATETATVAFRFDDHIGAVAMDRGRGELHGFSWGSRVQYRWRVGAARATGAAWSRAAAQATPNTFHYIDYQDCHGVGGDRMLCGGLADHPTEGGGVFQLGGLELIDLADGRPVWQLPIPLRSPSGRPMTQNPVFLEATATGLRAYFAPDDDASTLYVYDVAGKAPGRRGRVSVQSPVAPATRVGGTGRFG